MKQKYDSEDGRHSATRAPTHENPSNHVSVSHPVHLQQGTAGSRSHPAVVALPLKVAKHRPKVALEVTSAQLDDRNLAR